MTKYHLFSDNSFVAEFSSLDEVANDIKAFDYRGQNLEIKRCVDFDAEFFVDRITKFVMKSIESIGIDYYEMPKSFREAKALKKVLTSMVKEYAKVQEITCSSDGWETFEEQCKSPSENAFPEL